MNLRHPVAALGALGGLALILAACGSDGDDDKSVTGGGPGGGDRTIEVGMADNDFDPAALSFEKGETVTFRFTNTGKVQHDAYIGDAEDQADHETEMNGDDTPQGMDEGMDMGADTTTGHMGGADDEDAVIVEPGKTAELTYTFDKPGIVEIGCHEPGHYAGGMKIRVDVS